MKVLVGRESALGVEKSGDDTTQMKMQYSVLPKLHPK
jgi:hypothetical protein